MYVIVTNHVNWHRENLRSDRENTGNVKMKFEWVPCLGAKDVVFKDIRTTKQGCRKGRVGGVGRPPPPLFLGANFIHSLYKC